MIEVYRPFLGTLGKAKAAKAVRDLVDERLQSDRNGDDKASELIYILVKTRQATFLLFRSSLLKSQSNGRPHVIEIFCAKLFKRVSFVC